MMELQSKLNYIYENNIKLCFSVVSRPMGLRITQVQKSETPGKQFHHAGGFLTVPFSFNFQKRLRKRSMNFL